MMANDQQNPADDKLTIDELEDRYPQLADHNLSLGTELGDLKAENRSLRAALDELHGALGEDDECDD